jgi:hypothetical protein
MHTDTDTRPGALASAVRDRVDTLLLGHGAAARRRVLRLVLPADAGAGRTRLYSSKAVGLEGPKSAPTALVRSARHRVAALLSSAPAAAEIAA